MNTSYDHACEIQFNSIQFNSYGRALYATLKIRNKKQIKCILIKSIYNIIFII